MQYPKDSYLASHQMDLIGCTCSTEYARYMEK